MRRHASGETWSAGGPVARSTIVFVRRMARGAAYQSPRSTYRLFARLRFVVPVIPIRPIVADAKPFVPTARLFGWSAKRRSEVLKYIIRDRVE